MALSQNTPSMHFTQVDELRASTVKPLPWAKANAVVGGLRTSLGAVLRGKRAPTANQLGQIADCANVAEVLIELGYIDDPDKLCPDIHLALADGLRQRDSSGLVCFGEKAAADMHDFVEAFEKMLGELSARKVIHAYRLTEIRVERALRGEPVGSQGVLEVWKC